MPTKPKFVPAEVWIEYRFRTERDPSSDFPNTWAAIHDSIPLDIKRNESDLEAAHKRGDHAAIAQIRNALIILREDRDSHERESAARRRLVQDERMRKAYASLEIEFAEGRAATFFKAAVESTGILFEKQGDVLEVVRRTSTEIERAAKHLARLVANAQQVELYPWFFCIDSVRFLLTSSRAPKKTLRTEAWDRYRSRVLGETERLVPTNDSPDDPSTTSLWQGAPSMTDLLLTLAGLAEGRARDYENSIKPRIASRKKDARQGYLRFLLDRLIRTHGWTLTPALEKAIAITATVLLEQSRPVTPQEVRRAFKLLGRD